MISENRSQHLGKIFRLVEQFELISRTDLAKLSGFAPASITNLTKSLIDHKFILERTVQNSTSRGRPAVGLAVSPFFWQLLCLTISPNKIEILLCELNGTPIHKENYTVSSHDYPSLDQKILADLQDFYEKHPLDDTSLFAVSISVIGRTNAKKTKITQLGCTAVSCKIVESLKQKFSQPILLNEHFQLWLLTESTLGSLIRNSNVIFLQLDEVLRLNVMVNGTLLHKNVNMNIDHLLTPSFGEMTEEIARQRPTVGMGAKKYQISNQITTSALAILVDKHLPNSLKTVEDKITYLCEQVEANHPEAIAIIDHLSSHLAYLLLNLLQLFSSEKVMINSPLLRVKAVLFEQIFAKLANYGIHFTPLNLVTSQLEWNSPLITTFAIKQGIYDGNLIKNRVPLEKLD